MRLPVRLEHLPTFRNHALPSISHLTRPAGIGADQVCATYETRRHPPVGETVELRATSPDKDTIVRSRLIDDLLNNREKIECLRSHYKSPHEKTYCRQSSRSNNAYSDPSPASRKESAVASRQNVRTPGRQESKAAEVRPNDNVPEIAIQ